jgi:hypothetical protein
MKAILSIQFQRSGGARDWKSVRFWFLLEPRCMRPDEIFEDRFKLLQAVLRMGAMRQEMCGASGSRFEAVVPGCFQLWKLQFLLFDPLWDVVICNPPILVRGWVWKDWKEVTSSQDDETRRNQHFFAFTSPPAHSS